MAGRGPAPKERALRRKGESAATEVLPAEGYSGKVPKLPAAYSVTDGHNEVEVRFLEVTREWYARWSRSPMATRFTDPDWDRLRFVIAPLFDRFLRSSSKELAGEIRLQETLLGATVMDRQRMRVRVGAEADAPAAPRRSRSSAKLRAV
jgi:hypothetical protein